MHGIALIVGADLLLALSFVFQKLFEKRFGSTPVSAARFLLLCGMVKSLFFALLCLFTDRAAFAGFCSAFSISLATVQALLVTAYTLISFQLLKDGGMTLYTLFLMAGGMLLPYFYGVLFLNEGFTILRVCGLVLLVGALCLYNLTKKNTVAAGKKTRFLCVAVFILNGFVSIVSKRHQIETVLPVANTNGFSLLTALAGTLCSAFLYAFLRHKTDAVPSVKRPHALRPLLLFSIGTAVFGGLSYLLQLTGALSLPATLLYPAITGGSIVLSALADLIFFANRPDKRQCTGLALAFIGTCFFL